jgi:uncharacterized damage-inducible protein DinB
MNTIAASRPQPNEYAPYYDRYISLIAEQDIVGVLERQLKETAALLATRSEQEGDFRYAPGKWSVKEVIGHVTDTERIFAYRVLRIARNDSTPIEGFEQDDYVRFGPFAHCSLADLAEEFSLVRRATLAMLTKLDQQAWTRRGVANQSEISARALAWIIAGHELHHRGVLEEKYFSK